MIHFQVSVCTFCLILTSDSKDCNFKCSYKRCPGTEYMKIVLLLPNFLFIVHSLRTPFMSKYESWS